MFTVIRVESVWDVPGYDTRSPGDKDLYTLESAIRRAKKSQREGVKVKGIAEIMGQGSRVTTYQVFKS